MFSTDLLSLIAIFGALFAILASVFAFLIANQARRFVWTQNKRSVGLKRLTEIETELTEAVDSIQSLHDSLRKLRARVGMREARAAKAANGSGIPDSTDDPAGYKRAMRLKLRSEGKMR